MTANRVLSVPVYPALTVLHVHNVSAIKIQIIHVFFQTVLALTDSILISLKRLIALVFSYKLILILNTILQLVNLNVQIAQIGLTATNVSEIKTQITQGY